MMFLTVSGLIETQPFSNSCSRVFSLSLRLYRLAG